MVSKNTIEIVINAKDNASKVLGGVGKNIQDIGKIAIGGFGALTAATAAVGVGIAKLALDAAPLVNIENAFAGIAESAGTGMDEMLRALQEGSGGMIANRDLMLSFNKAAQLVSTDFATRLPDAMGSLSKVAAATGQDLDFLLDSLVTGVGRLSPMILDNLGIQVDLTAAQEEYAESIGKSVKDLTKQEQQTALMNQVMEKLTANTAAMPDVAGSAAAGVAQMEATFTNLKDELGKAFLPALNTVLTTFSDLAARVMPIVTDFFMNVLAPAVETVIGAFSEFIGLILAGEEPITALVDVLANFLPEEVIVAIEDFVAGVKNIIDTVAPYVQMAVDWIAQNIQLKDVLIALGIAIASVVVPALVSVMLTIAPIIATIAALIGAVALMRKVWEEDIGGIRTFLTEAFAEISVWLSENIPIAIETARAFWEDTLKPALETVWAFIQDSIVPIFEALVIWLGETIPVAVQALSDLWQNVLKPALEIVWTFIQDSLFPLLTSLWELISVSLSVALTALAGIWENVLKPALETVYNFIKDNINPVLETMKGWLEAVGNAIDVVIGWISNLAAKIGSIQLPDWMTPGSPTPLELGLRGIANAMSELSSLEIPRFQASLDRVGASSPGQQVVNNFNMTVSTQAPISTVQQDFATMAALAQ